MKAIAAVTKDYGVGYKNGLLFKLKQDIKWFKEQTMGKTCIMGYKTFMSLPVDAEEKVILPGRKKVVLCYPHQASSVLARGADHVILDITSDLIEEYKDAYVIGGSVCWRLFSPYIDTLYLTHIDAKTELTDTFFPYTLFMTEDSDKWVQELVWEEEEKGIKMVCKKYQLS